MVLRNVIIYGHPTLRRESDPVEAFDDDLKKLVGDMVETMLAEPGIGLAANQVNVPLMVAIVDLSVGKDPEQLFVLVNPKITNEEGKQLEEEGCLSVPGINARVPRPYRVTVEAQDLDGHPFTVDAEGLLARAFCHEIDHLHGILFVDYVKGLERRLIRKKLHKLEESA